MLLLLLLLLKCLVDMYIYRCDLKGTPATASIRHFPVHEPITLRQDTVFAGSALQMTSAQLLSTKLLMLACFRQSDLFSLFFFPSVLNLKALWNCMSAVRIHKDRPSFITIDIQLLTCRRQNLPPQLINIHPFRRFSWFYWHHWKRCIYCLKGAVLYNNNFKGSPKGTGIFDVWYINIVNCERLKQWIRLQGPKHLGKLFWFSQCGEYEE